MKRQLLKWFLIPSVMLVCTVPCMPSAAQSPDTSGEVLRGEKDGWKEYESPRGKLLRREVTIYPAAENATLDSPRLLPRDDEMRDANAAIWYLKALGFLEQTASQQAIARFHSEQAERMSSEPNFEPAPWVWLEMPPSQLPLQDVEQYLSYSNFQPELLHQAARCRNFDLDRDIRTIDNIAEFRLSEIQALRQLGRNQSLRCRLAIAEGDFAAARTIIGENLQLAHQLSAEPFLVSTLIGRTIAQSSFDDALYLVAEPSSPNLYWAIAELPNPLVDASRAMEFETELLFLQVRPLRKIGLVPLAETDWSEFLAEVMPLMGDECNLVKRFKSAGMLGASLFIASAGPEVEAYLLNECDMSDEQLDKLPATQAFFLAVVRMYETASREAAQLVHAPTSAQAAMISTGRKRQERASDLYPVLSNTIHWVAPRVERPVVEAGWRLQQRLALLQTVESIRDHLAKHDSQWPEALSDLSLPAPHDPVTDDPFAWSVQSGKATLTAAFNGDESLEILLEAAKPQADSPEAPATPANRKTAKRDREKSIWRESLQIDGGSSLAKLFPASLIERLNPNERRSVEAIQPLLQRIAQDQNANGHHLLRQLFPAFLADLDQAVEGQTPIQDSSTDESLRPGLDAVAEYPVRWVVALPESFRRVFAETRPTIDRVLPGGPSLAWIESVKWLAIGVDADRGIFKCMVQCPDLESAMRVQSQLPHVGLALYRLWVDPQAKEFPATDTSLFKSEVAGDRVTFTLGGEGQRPDAMVSMIRLLSVGFENSLNDRIQSKMSTLLWAVHQYHASHNRVPPFAEHADHSQRLGLSWRVHLLPFIGDGEYVELFNKFHLDEPWDSEHNRSLLPEIPAVYQAPMALIEPGIEQGLTTLLAPANETPLLGGKHEHGFRQILDGTSNTVAIVEVRPERAVPWTKPADYEYAEDQPMAGLMTRRGKTVVATGDGWAGAVPSDQGDDVWRGIFTISGREDVVLKRD